MRKVAVYVGGILLLPLALMAQSVPKIEMYGGYSFLRIQEISHHGWNLTFGPNVNNNLGITTEISGHYGSRTDTLFPGLEAKTDSMVHSFMLGPRVFQTVGGNWIPYVQGLFGITRVDVDETLVQDGNRVFSASDGDLGFGMVLGGGLDVKVNDAVAFRIFQADYNVVRVGGTRFEGGRVSTGVVLRLGQRD
ncbi:MAG: outer membrane beta-barrel protein [Acidobacteria bacterium]|nr:outer membrane beta-barrel protein [Acidobacteriota bacterium]